MKLLAQALTTDTIWGEFAILPLVYRDIIHSVLSLAESRGFLPFTAKIVTSPNKFKLVKIGLYKEDLRVYVDYELFVDPDDPNSDGVQIISKGAPMPIPKSTSSEYQASVWVTPSSAFDIDKLDTLVSIHPTDPDILDKLNLIFK